MMMKTPPSRRLVSRTWPLLGIILCGLYFRSERVVAPKDVDERVAVSASSPLEAASVSADSPGAGVKAGPPEVNHLIREAQRRRGSFTFDGNVGILRGESWRCKFHKGLVRFVAGAPEAFLEYRLTDVRIGGCDLLDGRSPVARRLSDDTFCWDRGGVEELYRREDQAMEQSFRIAARPAFDGDLVVRGRVRTNLETPEGARGSTLTFRRGGEEALAIRDAVAVDARGRRLPIDMEFRGGELAMRVPASWLRDAEYPVVVDPAFGNLILPDAIASGGPEENQDSHGLAAIDVAYNPAIKEYFIVWNERFSAGDLGGGGIIVGGGVPGDFDIWSCRVNAKSGQLVQAADNPNPIDADPEQTGDCRVAYNSALDRYLTVYRYVENSGGPASPDQVRGRVTKGSGGNDPGPDGNDDLNTGFQINPDLFDGKSSVQPVVAAAAGRWLVAWAHLNPMMANGAGSVFARFVTGPDAFDGTLWPVQLGQYDANGWPTKSMGQPSVAFNPTSGLFLVAWQVTDYSTWTGEIESATATSAYPSVLGPVTAVSAKDSVESSRPDVAANPVNDEFLVAWQDDTEPISWFGGVTPDHDVMGRRLNGNGVVVASPAVLIGGAGADGAPRVDYNPVAAAYILAWKRDTYTEVDFMGRTTWLVTDEDMLAATFTAPLLNPLEVETPIAAVVDDFEFQPAVRCRTDAGQALVAWYHQVPSTSATTETPEAIRFFMGPGNPPAPPSTPTSGSLVQSGDPGGAPEPVGFADADGIVSMRAAVSDPNSGETVALQVEIKVNGSGPFDGTALVTGAYVPGAGGVSTATPPLLADGAYQWRARTINSLGLTSSWIEFDPQGLPDFFVGTPPPPGEGAGNAGKQCAGSAGSSGLSQAASAAVILLMTAAAFAPLRR